MEWPRGRNSKQVNPISNNALMHTEGRKVGNTDCSRRDGRQRTTVRDHVLHSRRLSHFTTKRSEELASSSDNRAVFGRKGGKRTEVAGRRKTVPRRGGAFLEQWSVQSDQCFSATALQVWATNGTTSPLRYCFPKLPPYRPPHRFLL